MQTYLISRGGNSFWQGERFLRNMQLWKTMPGRVKQFHKIQQNEIEQIQGTVLINIYTCDMDIDSSSEPSSNKL